MLSLITLQCRAGLLLSPNPIPCVPAGWRRLSEPSCETGTKWIPPSWAAVGTGANGQEQPQLSDPWVLFTAEWLSPSQAAAAAREGKTPRTLVPVIGNSKLWTANTDKLTPILNCTETLSAAGRFLGRKVEEMPHEVVNHVDSPAEESIPARPVTGTGTGPGTPTPQELSCIAPHSSHQNNKPALGMQFHRNIGRSGLNTQVSN